MKFSLNWLKDYVDIEISVDELVQRLTFAGLEVESVTPICAEIENVIIGQIKKLEKHPNADKLQICQIWDGQTMHQIVTGAANVFEGAVVPASLPGATLAGGFKIKSSALRGVESHGMLCSEKELGLVDEAHGIWLLPPDSPLGAQVVEHFQLRDTILDISILPNRGDVQSILGMAREIAVILDKPLKIPEFKINELDEGFELDIEVLDQELCPKYTGRVIKNVQIKPSPFWLARRLTVSGLRPINNVVDITNYVLLEYGQPLHAFDLAYLAGSKIIVRTAKNNEKMQTLDGNWQELNEQALLICDAEKPVALAGIMGGLNSEIKETTQNVLLEAAFFKPGGIRKTEMKLGLRTESSIRFEKGIDFNNVELASNKAAYLMQQLADAKILKGLKSCVDSASVNNQPRKIAFSAAQINQLLGSQISQDKMVEILAKLGFEFNVAKTEVTVPSWRQMDVFEFPCLAEEVARIIGLDQIPTTLTEKAILMKPETALEKLSKSIEENILALGFSQIKTFSMISQKDMEATCQAPTTLILKNPLTIEESIMRNSLLASGLKVLSLNYKHQILDLKLFEIGKIFLPVNQEEHTEELVFQALVTGKIAKNCFTQSEKQNNNLDFRYLKAIAEKLLAAGGYKDISYLPQKKQYLHPVQALIVCVNDQEVGEVGLLHPLVGRKYDVDAEIGVVTLNLAKLVQLKKSQPKFVPFTKFPAIRRDAAFIVPKSLPYAQIQEIIAKIKPRLIKELFLFDCFEAEKLGADKRSLAFAFIYQSDTETLVDEKVNTVHTDFCKRLQDSLPIELPS